MFTNVSWGTFFSGVALMCLAWYIYVGLRYYRQEIQLFFNHRQKNNSKAATNPPGDNFFIAPIIPVLDNKSLEDDFFKDVDHLIGRIKKIFLEAREKNAHKNELHQYLRLLLKEYPQVKDSPFRSQINEIITTEDIGGDYFTDPEAEQLW